MTVLAYRLALAWAIAAYLAMYAFAVLAWLYGHYRVSAHILWPVAVLFALLLPKGVWL